MADAAAAAATSAAAAGAAGPAEGPAELLALRALVTQAPAEEEGAAHDGAWHWAAGRGAAKPRPATGAASEGSAAPTPAQVTTLSEKGPCPVPPDPEKGCRRPARAWLRCLRCLVRPLSGKRPFRRPRSVVPTTRDWADLRHPSACSSAPAAAAAPPPLIAQGP
ncbi:unnamed protein product, partial [Prorocentrum cordatum]